MINTIYSQGLSALEIMLIVAVCLVGGIVLLVALFNFLGKGIDTVDKVTAYKHTYETPEYSGGANKIFIDLKGRRTTSSERIAEEYVQEHLNEFQQDLTIRKSIAQSWLTHELNLIQNSKLKDDRKTYYRNYYREHYDPESAQLYVFSFYRMKPQTVHMQKINYHYKGMVSEYTVSYSYQGMKELCQRLTK